MKKLLIAFFLSAVVISMGSCSRYRVIRNQTDNSATWSSYRTFAFVDTNRIEETPRDTYQAAVTQVKQAVANELTKRGYQQTKDNPDLLVNLGTVVKEKTQTRPTTIYEAPLYIG